MSKSVATLGAGAVLSYATLTGRTPGSYTALAEAEDLMPPKKQRAKVEITNHDSANRKEENIPGFFSLSDPTAKFIYTKAQHAILDDMSESATLYGFKLTYADGSTHTWIGYVTELGLATPLKDKMTSDITFASDDSVLTFTPSA